MSVEEQRPLAREAALRLLAVRERSESELRTRLRTKGFDRLVIDDVIVRLQEAGLQDDSRFAERFAEGAVARGMAGRRIRADLVGKGVERDLAAEAATARPEDEENRARELGRARAARMRGVAPEARARRVFGLLARRGYPPDICSRVASEVSEDAGEDPAAG